MPWLKEFNALFINMDKINELRILITHRFWNADLRT